jgi:hypothetical protein
LGRSLLSSTASTQGLFKAGASMPDAIGVGAEGFVGLAFRFCFFDIAFLEQEECAHDFPAGGGIVFVGNASAIFQQVRWVGELNHRSLTSSFMIS